MTPERYDFDRPPAIAAEARRRLLGWLDAFCALASKQWAKHLPIPVALKRNELSAMQGKAALASITDAAVGCRIVLQPGDVHTLLVLPRPLVLLLVGTMVGDDVKELPADRELTVVETSLSQYLFQNLFCAPLQVAWDLTDELQVRSDSLVTNPRWSKAFAPGEPVIACDFTADGAFGKQPLRWILPKKPLQRLLGASDPLAEETATGPSNPTIRLEALVRTVPVTVTVRLGTVEVPLSQLSKIKVGDVVVLDQATYEPLSAYVGDELKFSGWPGRQGKAQAFRIETVVQ